MESRTSISTVFRHDRRSTTARFRSARWKNVAGLFVVVLSLIQLDAAALAGDPRELAKSSSTAPSGNGVAVEKPAAEPTDVVAHVRGQAVLRRDIEPPAQWHQQRAEYERQHGHTRGYEAPDDYPVNRLYGLICKPIFEQYRAEHELEPTEEEFAEFIVRKQQAKLNRRQTAADNLAQLQTQVLEDQAGLDSKELPTNVRKRLEQRLSHRESRIKELETELAKPPEPPNPQADRFSAQWYLGRWKLQQSLYKKYGGRAIWQQVGPEAIDAMRDLLKEKESDGYFTIHDTLLRKRFWEPYTREDPIFEISNPERVFEHPWPVDDETSAASATPSADPSNVAE